jgi:hypothetical protein
MGNGQGDLARAAEAKNVGFLADNEGDFFIFGGGGGARGGCFCGDG